jgi:hypothetical protein
MKVSCQLSVASICPFAKLGRILGACCPNLGARTLRVRSGYAREKGLENSRCWVAVCALRPGTGRAAEFGQHAPGTTTGARALRPLHGPNTQRKRVIYWNRQLATDNWQPTTGNRQLATDN